MKAKHILVSFCNIPTRTTSPLVIFEIPERKDKPVSCAPVSLSYPKLVTSATGLAYAKGKIFVLVASHGHKFGIVALQENNLSLLFHQELPEVNDGHSILVIENHLYVVSTGTDEVIRYEIETKRVANPTVIWQASDTKRDTHHINSIIEHNGEILISAFGPKTGQLWSTALNGYILNITSNSLVEEGIYHPHSLCVRNGKIYYSDSHRNSLCVVGQADAILDLNGYARGTSWLSNNMICLATSIGRRISKSTGFIANPADPGEPAGECSLLLADMVEKKIVRKIDLSWFGPEIYDVFVIPEFQADLLTLSNFSQRSERQAIQVLTSDLIETNQQVQAINSQLQTVTAQLILKENEMNQILESRSWRFVQLLQHIKLTLIPVASKRERIVYSFFRGLRAMLDQGLRAALPGGIKNIKRIWSRRNRIANTPDLSASTSSSNPEVYVQQSPESIDSENVLVKLIAFYLPQFHPIPENDEWWGKGFTEWTNVSKAVPNFHGHYQPRLPGELGFYDLRLPEIQQRQVELAKKYGIYGFCFYYYWFAGKRLLEGPLDQYIASPNLDLPFCLCWANENWTRRWDGDENEILISQDYSEAQYLQFIQDISPNFSDPRYIHIDGKPVLLVYRINLLPDPKKAAEVWRSECRKSGVGEIYLVAVQSFGITDPHPFGFDAAVEFPPSMLVEAEVSRNSVKITNPRFAGQIFDYNTAVRLMMEKEHKDYTAFKTVVPSWDNTARKQDGAHIFINSSPAAYREWLTNVIKYSQRALPEDKRFVFINAWNEWAEGAYLEPDRKFGYAYLQATADALVSISMPQKYLEKQEAQYSMLGKMAERDTAVIIHLYYPELWDEIRSYLSHLEDEFDLFVTIPHTVTLPYQRILKYFPNAHISQFPNRGRDIAPFIRVFNTHIYPQGYKFVLKLHTKRSLHRQDGNHWRKDLLEKLVGSQRLVQQIKMILRDQTDVGIVAPHGHVLPSSVYWGQNEKNVRKLASWVNIPFDDNIFPFVAGSMFWFKPSAFYPITQLDISQEDFGPEKGQVDGTLAHAFERFFGLLMLKTGYRIIEIEKSGIAITSQPQNRPEYPFAAESNFHTSSTDADNA